MAELEDRVQTTDYFFSPDKHQPKVLKHIYNWARTQPASFNGVLDLGAGLGLDVGDLLRLGIPTIGIEPDKRYLEKNSSLIYGTVSAIPMESKSVSGAYLKDAMIFLSPQQRYQMIGELRRVLVPGGSFLVISEILDVSRATFPLDQERQKIHPTVYRDDYFSYDDWILAVQLVVDSVGVRPVVGYQTNIDALTELTSAFNLRLNILKQFGKHDELAVENRCAPYHDGFIAQMSF